MNSSPRDDPSVIQQRIIAHLSFARAVAYRALDARCHGADREDLISCGIVGLVQAAQRYRDDRGSSFSSYAARRIRGQVLDALRERDPLTRSARRAFRIAREANAELPSPFTETSLDKALAGGWEPRSTATSCAATTTRHDERWKIVLRHLHGLPRVERRVLVLSYVRGLTLKEIGRQIGLSESGVCRVRSRALSRMRGHCEVSTSPRSKEQTVRS